MGLFQQILKRLPVAVATQIQVLLDTFLAGVSAIIVSAIMRRTLVIPSWKC